MRNPGWSAVLLCLAVLAAGMTAPAAAAPAGVHAVFEIDLKAWWRDQIEEYSYSLRSDAPRHRLSFTRKTIDDQAIALHYDDTRKLAADRDYLEPILAARENRYAISQPGPHTLLVAPAPDNRRAMEDRVVAQSITIIHARLRALTQKDPTVIRAGAGRIAVTIADASDPAVFDALIGPVGRLTLQQVDDRISEADLGAGRAPPGETILPMADSTAQHPHLLAVYDKVLMRGDRIVRAMDAIDENTAEPIVMVYLDKRGAAQFAHLTRALFFRRMAVIIDGIVMTAPMVREPILGGVLQISGDFTPQRALDLASRLTPGGMPAPVRIVESGPGLPN